MDPSKRDQWIAVATLSDTVHGDLLALQRATIDSELSRALSDAIESTSLLKELLSFQAPVKGVNDSSVAVQHFDLDLTAPHSTLDVMRQAATSPDELTEATRQLDRWGLTTAQILAGQESLHSVAGWFRDVAERYRRREMARQLREIELANLRAQEVVKDVEEAASTVSTGNLAEHFTELEKNERDNANLLRWLAVGLLVIVSAALALLVDVPEDPSVADVLRHYGLGLPALFIAAYLARESGHHRASARWAGGLAVQLRTFKAFTDAMPEHIRDDVRAVFGRRLFLEANPTGTTGKTSSMSEVDQLLQRLIDLGFGGAKDGPTKP